MFSTVLLRRFLGTRKKRMRTMPRVWCRLSTPQICGVQILSCHVGKERAGTIFYSKEAGRDKTSIVRVPVTMPWANNCKSRSVHVDDWDEDSHCGTLLLMVRTPALDLDVHLLDVWSGDTRNFSEPYRRPQWIPACNSRRFTSRNGKTKK